MIKFEGRLLAPAAALGAVVALAIHNESSAAVLGLASAALAPVGIIAAEKVSALEAASGEPGEPFGTSTGLPCHAEAANCFNAGGGSLAEYIFGKSGLR